MEKRTTIIEYEVLRDASDLYAAFGLDPEAWAEKWATKLTEVMQSSDTKMSSDFIDLLEQNFFTGSELMALAFAGFKSPNDMEHMMRKMALGKLQSMFE